MKKRSEMDSSYFWDLSLIFKSEEEILDTKEDAKKTLDKLVSYKDKIMDTKDNLLDVFELSEQLDSSLYKLYMYYHLKLDEDLTNSKAQDDFNKIIAFITDLESQISFITPEILKADKKYLIELKESEKFNDFKRSLEKLIESSEYILSTTQELIMSNSAELQSISSNVYSTLVNSDIKFNSVLDKDKNEVEVSEANYGLIIRGEDRVLRENFFKSLLKGYGAFNNTLTGLFLGELKSKDFVVKSRGYSDLISKALVNNEVEIEIYENLIKSVRDNLQTNYDYLQLRKELLDVEELHLYDTYVPIISGVSKNYEFDDAKEILLEAFSVLGEDYLNNINKAFDEKWIDVYPNEGKRSGAYSSGSYDTVPYILLNYNNNIEDLFTLAHELGHSMHTYYTNNTQKQQNSHYKIFVAEIASTVNELLLLNSLLTKTEDNEIKSYLLNYNLDQFRTTVYRQTMFAEFEQIVNEKFFKEKSVSSEELNNIYFELNEDYFGNDVVIDEEIKYEWSRIPHFYYDFYVYQYATCFCIATAIVKEIKAGNKEIVEKYKKFLSNGDVLKPIDLVAEIGLDIRNIDVFNDALKEYEETLEKLKKILEEK